MFYTGFDAFFSILFPLVFLVVLGMILFTVVSNLRTWGKNNASPRLTVPATVVAKRTNVSRHHTDNTMSHTFTTYYATFQVESGDRMELEVDGSDYGMLLCGRSEEGGHPRKVRGWCPAHPAARSSADKGSA